MMPSNRLVLALADASPFAPPPNRPTRPNRRTERGSGQVRTFLRDLRRHVDLAVRDQAGPWIPRITARYPY
jgi:hypothetical protein